MKVTVSVKGRFHAFNLAAQLQRLGALQCLITSYPSFETVKYGVPQEKIRSLLAFELLERSWRSLPSWLKRTCDVRHVVSAGYDRAASRQVPVDADIFVGWSSFSRRCMQRAKQYGAKTVLERGSSHIAYQYEMMRAEYDRFGVAQGELTHPRIIEDELAEYEEADYLSVPSLYVKQSFLEKGYPEQKIIHVPYGVDLKSFVAVPKQDKTFRVIHCGGLSLRKGVHYLLQAFAELRLPRAELWLIGSINDEIKPFLERYAVPSIRQLGPFPQAELYKYYSQGSVFCLASIEEGLAMVQAQAMACGLPVICTTNTGGADIVRDGVDGFVVPIRDVDALKQKIQYLYEHEDARRAMAGSAHRRVTTGFSWTDYGNNMHRHYERILSG